jgi:glycosyltransferase involved in cell wall biosynthesis
MMSIIICSRSQFISNDLVENIKSTIGCKYELIIINNSDNQFSIFQAYNIGIEKSIGEYLCFMHDDILIHSNDWGKVVNRIFEENLDFGLIGVAGAKIKTKIPNGWWDCEEKYKSVNIIQHFRNGNVEKQCIGFEDTMFNEVVFIDGVFMVLRKKTNFFFNQDYSGFHNYDFNISFEILKKGFKLGVTNEILIEHFSTGVLDKDWLKSTINMHKRYRMFLPTATTRVDFVKMEIFGGKRFINHCFRIEGRKKVYMYFFSIFNLNLFSKSQFSLLKYFTKAILKI